MHNFLRLCIIIINWNSLLPAVVNRDTLYIFKSRLKTHLFNIAYCQLTCSASASEAMALWRSTNALLSLLLFRMQRLKWHCHIKDVAGALYCMLCSYVFTDWLLLFIYIYLFIYFISYLYLYLCLFFAFCLLFVDTRKKRSCGCLDIKLAITRLV